MANIINMNKAIVRVVFTILVAVAVFGYGLLRDLHIPYTEDDIVTLVNEARDEAGLNRMVQSPSLNLSGFQNASWMNTRIVYDVRRAPSEINIYLNREGHFLPAAYTTISLFRLETLDQVRSAFTYDTVREKILDPQYTHIGVGFGRSINGVLFTYIILAR